MERHFRRYASMSAISSDEAVFQLFPNLGEGDDGPSPKKANLDAK
jgi:hypothetical protein